MAETFGLTGDKVWALISSTFGLDATSAKIVSSIASVFDLDTTNKIIQALSGVYGLSGEKIFSKLVDTFGLDKANKIQAVLAETFGLTGDKVWALISDTYGLSGNKLLLNVADIITLTGQISAAIDTGDIVDANAKIQDLITLLGVPGLTKAVTGATSSTGDLTNSLLQTYYPFDETASNLTSLSNSIKDNLTTLWGFFDTLATNLGITLNPGTATALINAGAFTKTVLQQGHWEQFPVLYGFTGQQNQWGNDIWSQYYMDPKWGQVFGNWGYSKWATVYVPAGFDEGGLTKGLSFAGEIGREWVVPTYEPQRSAFLQDVGVNPAEIAHEIMREIMIVGPPASKGVLQYALTAYSLPTAGNSFDLPTADKIDIDRLADAIAGRLLPALQLIAERTGGDIVVPVQIDGREIGRVTARRLNAGDYDLVESVRRRTTK